MKKLMQITLLLIIAVSAVISISYALDLYRTKYVPRYLPGRAC